MEERIEMNKHRARKALIPNMKNPLIAKNPLTVTMFADLPQDLLKSVIIDWLDTNGLAVSALDVAFGHHVRGDWLHLLRSLRLVNPPPTQALPTFFSWVHDRGVQLCSLSVNLVLVEELDRVPQSFRFPALTTIAITNSGSPFGLMSLISLAPLLLVLDFSNCQLTDQQLLPLVRCCSAPLKELKLGNHTNSAAAVVAVAAHFSDTLQIFYSDVLDDLSVMSLARCCKKMKKIVWDVYYIASPACLVEFCAANVGLEHIEFSDCDRMTNEIMEQISLHCPILQVFVGRCQYEENLHLTTFHALSEVLLNWSDLRELSWAGMCLKFEKDGSANKFCMLSGNFKSAALHELLSHLPLPVRGYGEDCDISWIDRSCMNCLVERNHRSLRSVIIYCNKSSDVEQEHILHLCASCPNLEILELWLTSRLTIDEDIVSNISKRCPQLQQLNLFCSALTDATILAGISGFRDGVLTSIGFGGSRLITDVVVDKVEELFPHLQEFRLKGTAVSKERLLHFIHKHQSRGLRKVILPSRADNNWVNMQLHALGMPLTVSLSDT